MIHLKLYKREEIQPLSDRFRRVRSCPLSVLDAITDKNIILYFFLQFLFFF